MSSFFLKLENYLNNGKNFYKIYFFLVVFLFAVKLPSLLTSDIQPWDEGMYATRVLSIHTHGDFIDQSTHSVGKFYSASHPPLLIWIGYFLTLIFGVNAITLKLIVFIFSLLCVLLILLIGKKLFTAEIGFYASLIFCSNIIFEVFSQRFQFDIPYTFFILLTFYLIFLYIESLRFTYLFLSGLAFGCCLMTKILVGLYIPLILFVSYFFIKDKINFKLKDILILTAIGIMLALPWHLYILLKYGTEFTDYFFKFHIYDRAMQGVELNEKKSGIFYHTNYLLSIIPYAILAFVSLFNDLKNFKKRNWKELFFDIWLIIGLIILALFKTKLEVYVLMILLPVSFLIPLFIRSCGTENIITRAFIIFFLFLNLFWFATESVRPELKIFFSQSNKLLFLLSAVFGLIIIFYASRFLAYKIELKKTLYIYILIFFFTINIYYLFFVPPWVNVYNLSEIKRYVKKNQKEEIVYVGTNYRHNPQFSYYFSGLNLDWENPEFEFRLLDTEKIPDVRSFIRELKDRDFYLIVEKDYINRAVYPPSENIVPENLKLILKEGGYELYEN